MRRAFAFVTLCLACVPLAVPGRGAEAILAAGAEPKTAAKLECLKPGETREEVRDHHFLEPFVVLKSAAHEAKAEAISAKLCKLGDEWVYSIKLLRRNDTFYALLDAATGRVVPAHPHEPPKN